MEKIKKKKNIMIGIEHLCLLITIVMLIWIAVKPMLNEFGYFLQTAFILITGLGSVMIYKILGVQLEEIRKKYELVDNEIW